ncbi:TetR family transcriptional regulator [Streptomyces sp. NPDC050560]|uniref:TetR family transcriptional regulator n=1 Tax=Streptomyces sp. NPDC050560 TaxID=3365630 RepID=UPI0037BA804B
MQEYAVGREAGEAPGADAGEQPRPGLRERGKARRRAAIVRAAFRLFAERGYEATTIADIAHTAEVAPRTVALYFPRKQDIAFADFDASVRRLTELLCEPQADETMLDVFERWMRDEVALEDETATLSRRAFEANPELRAMRATRLTDAAHAASDAVALETGIAENAFAPRMIAAAAAAVVTELHDQRESCDPQEAITLAMTFLRGGVRSVKGGEE